MPAAARYFGAVLCSLTMGTAVLAVLCGFTGADGVSALIFRLVHRFNLPFSVLISSSYAQILRLCPRCLRPLEGGLNTRLSLAATHRLTAAFLSLRSRERYRTLPVDVVRNSRPQ